MPTILPFVRGGATKKAKSAATSAAKGQSSGSSSGGGGMKAMAQKFGGGGQQPSPAQAAAELAGKRLIPGHALPHVVLHTVQVGWTPRSLVSVASERVCVTSFDTRYRLCRDNVFAAANCASIMSVQSAAVTICCFRGEPRAGSVWSCHHTRFAFRPLVRTCRVYLAFPQHKLG